MRAFPSLGEVLNVIAAGGNSQAASDLFARSPFVIRISSFGDCFSYALARSVDLPLLFNGSDFSQTDVECHPASG
jgi:uncharacterized protein with PIN domain